MVPDETGPTHRYLESAPACWRIYGDVLVRGYADRNYYAVHPLSVDAYAVQHPGRPSKHTIQSSCVHLLRLCLVIERGWPPARATDIMRAFKERSGGRLLWLEPPEHRGNVTVVDLWKTSNALSHHDVAETWARSAWEAWSTHHEQVRGWADACS